MPIDDPDAVTRAAAGAPELLRHANWSLGLLSLGGLGLIITCVCYAIAGPVAALPGGSADWQPAIRATLAQASWMRAAGLFGVPSDVLLATGSALLALEACQARRLRLTTAWGLLGLAGVLFIPVDIAVGQVLPCAASDSTAYGYYWLLRTAFDATFAWGAVITGAGALLLAASIDASTLWRLVLAFAGGSGVLAGTAHVGGWTVIAPLAGPAIALIAIAITLWAVLRLRPQASRQLLPREA